MSAETAPAEDRVAFRLAAEYADSYDGGVIAITGGGDLNVGRELEAGNGVITTADPATIAALDAYRPLERATTPAPEPKAPKTSKAAQPETTTTTDAGDGAGD